jgi:hypothetical protein
MRGGPETSSQIQGNTAMSLRMLNILMVALSVGLSASLIQPPTVNAADAARIVDDLEASWPVWLPKPDQCPADLMPARGGPLRYSIESCSADVVQCLERCRAGDAGNCYSAAIVTQRIRNSPVSQALFQRACASGIVSGCTNQAAGMESGPGQSCAIRTYISACDHDDPWACTMIGFHLTRGIGVDKDHDRAKQAFAKSCRFGDDDDACRAAKSLLKEIGD